MDRDASYTTQPLELLNSLGFEISKNQTMLAKSTDVNGSDSLSFKDVDHGSKIGGRTLDQIPFGSDGETFGRNISLENLQQDYQEAKFQMNLEKTEGILLLRNWLILPP